MLLAEIVEGRAGTHLNFNDSQWYAGVPLEVEAFDGMTPDWLAAAPSGARFSGVHLPYDPAEIQWPPPAAVPSQLLSALTASASTLVELHDLPLRDQLAVGLAAFTQLRVLTLRQTCRMEALHAALLPASLEALTLQLNLPDMAHAGGLDPPLFAGFDRLRHLRRVTLVECTSWDLGSPALFAQSLEVRASSAM